MNYGFPPPPDECPGGSPQPGALSIENGVFKVGTTRKFLLLASYFGALRDAIYYPAAITEIFHAARCFGFHGVRIFATWWWDAPNFDLCGPSTSHDPYPLIRSDGSINVGPLPPNAGTIAAWQPPGGYDPSPAGRFQFLLDQAWQEGLVVDVSFAPEAVSGLWNKDDRPASMLRYQNALRTLADALGTLTYTGPLGPQTGYKHAFFDVANESNLLREPRCKPKFEEFEIRDNLLASVRDGDPDRYGTASTTEQEPDGEPVNNWAITDEMTANLVAYHEPRGLYLGTYPWHFMTYYRTIGYQPYGYVGYRQVTNDTIPIYFGEEERHRYLPESCNQYTPLPEPGCADNYTAQNFLDSARGAKAAGAAAYTWHTTKLFRWASNYSPGLTAVENSVVVNMLNSLNGVTWPR